MTWPVPTLRRSVRLLALAALSLLFVAASHADIAGAAHTKVYTIGEIQGSVSDTDDGFRHASPYAGHPERLTVRGVITERTRRRASSGALQYGFFIQNTAATADDDPSSSDGIFVFLGGSTSTGDTPPYFPQVGREIEVAGFVTEFDNLTELTSPRSPPGHQYGFHNLDVVTPPFETAPPDDLADAYRYWERREGMRARVPVGSLGVGGRDVFSPADGEAWVIHPDHPVAKRDDPYARRVFRDAHPLDNVPEKVFDDGNGYRILLGSYGIKWTHASDTAMVAPTHTFQATRNAAVGGVYQAFGKYAVHPVEDVAFDSFADPAKNAPPTPFDRVRAYSVTNFNVENLYDFRDDPTDPCDFNGPGNPRCINPDCPDDPACRVNPPYNYVPASDADYRAHLAELAAQIVHDVHGPDIVLIQEAEDQDICSPDSGQLVCGNAQSDGYPDTLQELALEIQKQGGPDYAAVADRDGADTRGITSAFLFRSDRVELRSPDPDHPVLGARPQVVYRSEGSSYNSDVQNPKVLNAWLPDDVERITGIDGRRVFTRAPQVGWFRIWRWAIGSGAFTDVYAISNHFSSGPETRVGQRIEQANYNAAIYDALARDDPAVRAIVGGDLNVFPRPDDPLPPLYPVWPSDQLRGLYDAGLTNLHDVLVKEAPASAYTYVFQGQAQTLDQQLVAPALTSVLREVRVAHVNSDWPEAYDEDSPRGASDHDLLRSVYGLRPSLGALEALVTYYAATGQYSHHQTEHHLLTRLTHARRFLERGQTSHYLRELEDFERYVERLVPGQIAPPAGASLVAEARLLREG